MRFRVRTVVLVVAMAACGGGEETDVVDARGPTPDANLDLLSQAGLYSDIAARQIAPGLVEFVPTFQLWSDGLLKRRWLRLPAGGSIDTTDMDHWVFPVGTQLWKEFRTPGGQLLETRLIERVGNADFRMGAFIWNEAQTDAVFTPAGQVDVLGTDHDVPTSSHCIDCHRGEPGRILGFSAIQLDPAIFAQVSFTDAPRESGFRPTWSEPLGYLHANCGNCHNPNGSASSATNLLLRLDVSEVDGDPTDTALHLSAVGVETQSFRPGLVCHDGIIWKRIAPNDLDCSAVYVRMMTREGGVQMPPIASEHPDTEAVGAVEAWILGL